MSVVSRDQIKQWFETGDYPTQAQFWAWIDSFLHLADTIGMDKIEGLISALQNKVQKGDISEGHITSRSSGIIPSPIGTYGNNAFENANFQAHLTYDDYAAGRYPGYSFWIDGVDAATLFYRPVQESESLHYFQLWVLGIQGTYKRLMFADDDISTLNNNAGYLARSLADTLYAALVHSHAIADVTNLQNSLNAKVDYNVGTGVSVIPISSYTGTGETASVDDYATATAGTVTVTTGTGVPGGAATALCTVLLGYNFGHKPHIILSPSNEAAAGLQLYELNGNGADTAIAVRCKVPFVDSTTYIFTYHVIK